MHLLITLVFQYIYQYDNLSSNIVKLQSWIYGLLPQSNAGLTKEVVEHISGHSIRVGAAQDLCLQGLSLPQIMAKGRWVKTETLMRYIEHTII